MAPPDDASSAVEVVPWPAGHERRLELATAGRPRLLAVDPGVAPPQVWELIEDWIRLPADPADVALRRQHLAIVSARTTAADRAPSTEAVAR